MIKKKILFLCTGNSCRSQMAEGWTRHLWKDTLDPYSAGIEKHTLNPYAVKVMAEVGIDISSYYPKTINELPIHNFDLVITVCDNVRKQCPHPPNHTKLIHVGFDDPPQLAQFAKTEEEILNIYRCIRDEIKRFIEIIDTYL